MYQEWKKEMPAFIEKTEAFYKGEVKVNEYKGFSGFYGSYAERGAQANMLRLRMSAGKVTKEKLKFVCDAIKRNDVKLAHFTTCQAIQLHNLNKEAVYDIMESALDAGIVCMGGGGDYPRNVMCSPLSGTEKDEYFDVMPYALAAAEFNLSLIKAEKMPRKLKVAFSNSKKNMPHATFRDLGFVARPDGLFDVYCAGGLGNVPRFGIKVIDGLDGSKICYAIKAMHKTFRENGNYENRSKARTRFMQETLGEEGLKEVFTKNFNFYLENEKLDVDVKVEPIVKEANGEYKSIFVTEQKQAGLYTVMYHPVGGQPNLEVLAKLADAIMPMDQVEMRLAPDESAYIVNLTGKEAELVNSIIEEDNAKTLFETSVSCIGATICQVGLRDSQGLLRSVVKAARVANIKDGALPQIHISGCTSSCGTHQTGILGFRGGVKMVDGKPESAFVVYAGGNDLQHQEIMGKELGTMCENDIPSFLVKVGKTVEESGKDYNAWFNEDPTKLEELAKEYL